MESLNSRWRFCLAGLALLPLCAAAATLDGLFDNEKPWTEIEAQLPVFPEKANLIPFTVGAIHDTRFFIDGNSISVGSDRVLRYTLVIVSPTGAQNISYEGMRCDTAERRLYAFGRSDKTWSKARNNQWSQIKGSSNNPQVELLTSYFCTVGATEIMSAEDARRLLRQGGHPPAAGE